MLIFDIVNNAQ